VNFKHYQERAATAAVYPRPADTPHDCCDESLVSAINIIPAMYCALGLTGEAGEVAEQIKKSWRNNMQITAERREKIEAELGDVLWYVAQLATELGMDLDAIASHNLNKLAERKHDGTLKQRSSS
jgi:NTP pyrophosphatase (non-canonical NTP hydrolase)